MMLIWFACAIAAIALVAYAVTATRRSRLKRAGLYPQPGQATMADVERLLKQGLPVLAIRCYREIHGCSLREAKEAVASIAAAAANEGAAGS